jgi:hypothetical protein
MSCAQETLLNVFNEFFFEPLVTEMSDMIKHVVDSLMQMVNLFMHLVFLYGFWHVYIAVFVSYMEKKFDERNKKLTKKVAALEYAMANRGHKTHDDGRSYTW